MTNAELLAKFRAEIDKLYGEYKDKFHQCGDQYHLGLIDGLDMAEQVLDTLESEKPMNSNEGLEEELVKYIGYPEEDLDGKWKKKEAEEIARHFAQWGAEHLADARKTSPKDLEEAIKEAEEFAEGEWDGLRDNDGNALYTEDMIRYTFVEAVKWHKEQMMKEAVCYIAQPDIVATGNIIIPFIRIGYTALSRYGIKVGDKVRIIIVKED